MLRLQMAMAGLVNRVYLRTPEAFPKQKTAATKAIELDEALLEAMRSSLAR